MNLISCENCAVVLDKDNIEIPDIRDDEGVIINDVSQQEGYDFFPVIECPVCKGKIVDP